MFAINFQVEFQNKFMSKAGQNTQKGIFAQNWAALSLFLQFLKNPNFSYIQIEPEHSEDFLLVFKDGKKIVCESKYRAETFSHSHLKELLKKISDRKTMDDEDEILVICKNVSDNLVSLTKNAGFEAFREAVKTKLSKLGFGDEYIPLLSRVNFWVLKTPVESSELNYSLVSELLNIWVPEEEVRRFSNDILQNKISKKAITGSVYSRQDFDKDVNDFREEVQNRSDFFSKKNGKTEQFTKLESDVQNGKSLSWRTGSVAAFSTQWDLMSFAMDRLKKRSDLDLKKWDGLWKLNKVYYFAFGIFTVFENNLLDDKNKKYILNYIKNYTKTIRGFYRSDFFDVSVVRIVAKIIDSDTGSDYIDDAFLILKDLILFKEDELFYLKKSDGYDRGGWEKEEICKLLKKVYSKANLALKEKIFKLLITGFNITQDEGEFSHHAPQEVYEIIRDWLDEDFDGRFKKLVAIVAGQYDRYYEKFSKTLEFKGYEHMGGGISSHSDHLGSTHHISERHFVSYVLEPVIRKFYDSDKDTGWKFIKEEIISKNVSKKQPDFLNRSVCGIVIGRYVDSNEEVSEEAFEILRRFILDKGIPNKRDLIYQVIAGADLSDDKKWKLVSVTVEKYGIPVNPFVQRMVTDLAKRGHVQARVTMKQWFSSSEYYESFMFDSDSISSIRTLLDTDIDFAIDLFMAFITSDYVKKEKNDSFGAYSVSAVLYEILKRDYQKGLLIFRLLENEKVLSKYQQIVYSYGLFNHYGNDDSDNPELLVNVYQDVVDPFLADKDIAQICERISSENCREAFVQLASRLAVKKKMDEALRIVRVFINDPDPYLPGTDPHDREDQYNEHKRIVEGKEPNNITSVRGWCGWVLMKCSVLDGRKYVPEVIELTKKLVSSNNYYEVHMGCIALSALARNRITVLPSDKNIPYFNDDKVRALTMSKEVESIAFNLLERFVAWPSLVQKAMAGSVLQVFDPIRQLNEKDSLRVVTLLSKLTKEAIDDFAVLFIFYAEFRKNSFNKWNLKAPGFYDDLGSDKYDDKKFKKILVETIRKLQKEDPDCCFKFAASFEHDLRDTTPENNDHISEMALRYFELLTDKYSHNIFNLVYHMLESKLSKPDKYIKKWFDLLLKCFRIEKSFYDDQDKKGDIAKVYWYPSLYHSHVLELVYKNVGKNEFMAAAKSFFSFPKGMDLHESDTLVSTLKEIAKTNKEAKKILDGLKKRNPSKYWDLK